MAEGRGEGDRRRERAAEKNRDKERSRGKMDEGRWMGEGTETGKCSAWKKDMEDRNRKSGGMRKDRLTAVV